MTQPNKHNDALEFAAKHFEAYGLSHLQFCTEWTGIGLAEALRSTARLTAADQTPPMQPINAAPQTPPSPGQPEDLLETPASSTTANFEEHVGAPPAVGPVEQSASAAPRPLDPLLEKLRSFNWLNYKMRPDDAKHLCREAAEEIEALLDKYAEEHSRGAEMAASLSSTREPTHPNGLWMVYFEDADAHPRPEVFFGEGAEQAARARYERAKDHWSCHLLSRIPTGSADDKPSYPSAIEPLTFDAFRRANAARCVKWHPEGIASWSPSDWLTAVTGELGELASLLKMRNRERDGLPGNKFSPSDKQIADELADVLTYLDLLAEALGVDLGRAAAVKFNEVSERVGFPDRISVRADGTAKEAT